MTSEEREEDINYWWNGGFSGAFFMDSLDNPVEPKLKAAFRRVLLAMPDEDYHGFLTLRPQVVCQPVLDGTLWSYRRPVMPGQTEIRIYVLYFAPEVGTYSEERLTSTVAHETAHLILGHVGGTAAGHGEAHAEELTDRKVESWGFKAAYTDAERRELAERHRRARERSQQPKR